MQDLFIDFYKANKLFTTLEQEKYNIFSICKIKCHEHVTHTVLWLKGDHPYE